MQVVLLLIQLYAFRRRTDKSLLQGLPSDIHGSPYSFSLKTLWSQKTDSWFGWHSIEVFFKIQVMTQDCVTSLKTANPLHTFPLWKAYPAFICHSFTFPPLYPILSHPRDLMSRYSSAPLPSPVGIILIALSWGENEDWTTALHWWENKNFKLHKILLHEAKKKNQPGEPPPLLTPP